MRVKMLRSTFYSGFGRLPVNLEITVEDSIGQRWVKHGIAKEIIVYESTAPVKAAKLETGDEVQEQVVEADEVIEDGVIQDEVAEEKTEPEKLALMTKAELTSIATVKGIEIPIGAKKAEIIELLINT